MKLLIASDIHGDVGAARCVIEFYQKYDCDGILLLGDILYHGPRNNLPEGYSPKEVISVLNEYKDVIRAVRGNCDSEVDQMVLEFPIMADYALLSLDGLSVFATHGHLFNMENPPRLKDGEILLGGHTHILAREKFGNNNTYLNPGSVGIPKGGNPPTVMIYSDRCFTVLDTDGNELLKTEF